MPTSNGTKDMQITAEKIDRVVKRNNKYYMPDRVRIAVEHCLENDVGAITTEYRRLVEEFQSYEKLDEPALIDYRGALTLDTYTVYYLCRNMLIPSVALRDLALHPLFQEVPEYINVLDLGSGTGAVTLGLLSIFSNHLLRGVSLKITAVDSCIEALDRQSNIINDAKFNLHQVEYQELDVENANSLIKRTKAGGPYHFIFSANCLTEALHNKAIELTGRLPEILSDNGAIIIAEAQRNYTKSLTQKIAINANDMGLNVYYPCNSINCPYGNTAFCWVWRYHDYEIPDMNINGEPLQEPPKDMLVAAWLILTKQDISIYDPFKDAQPDLSWGPISRQTGNKRAICCEGHALHFSDESIFQDKYMRGHIVGLSDEGEVIEHYEI